MKKLLLLFFMLISVSMYCNAQNYTEVVYLKNGSIIKGVIIEQIPNVSLKVKTGDGSLIICKIEEIDKITKEEAYTRDYRTERYDRKIARRTLKGYKGFTDFGYINDVSDNNASKIELTTSHGYQFNNYFFIGGGLSVGYYTSKNLFSVPIFTTFRVNFINKKITPFADVKIGYSVGDIEGGYSTVGLGVRFMLKGKRAFNLTFEYNYQQYDTTEKHYYSYGKNYGSSSWDTIYDLDGIGIKFGFEF